MTSFYLAVDPLIIFVFRLVDNPLVGFALGLAWLALLTTVVGELCMGGVYLFNRKHFGHMHREMVRHNNLAIRALGYKDKTSYKACNSIANDEFGKNFFSGIALFASSMWPAFFGLAWLDWRFTDVGFSLPLFGTVGPAFFFVPTYIVVRIAFNKAKPWLPVFSTIKRKIAENEGDEKFITYDALLKKEDKDEDVSSPRADKSTKAAA